MQVRLSFLIVFFSALLLMVSPAFSTGGSAPSGEGVSPHCEAAIDKAAGYYSKCLLKASAKYAKSKKKNEDRLFAQQAKCEDKWSAQVARAQDRFGEDQCTPYVSEIADRTVTYAQGAAIEASGTLAGSVLFVQNGTGGKLSETNLTLTGVTVDQTGYFSDRPHRLAGHMPTEDFIGLWDEGETFADNPPNADFTCTVDGEVVNFVVELTSPFLCNTDDCPVHELSYSAAAVGDTVLPETPIACEGEANLFVDSCDDDWSQEACTSSAGGCDCRRACAGECGGEKERRWCRDVAHYDDGFMADPAFYCKGYSSPGGSTPTQCPVNNPQCGPEGAGIND